MTEDDLEGLIGQAYEAAIGVAPWHALGTRLCAVMDCTRATLLLGASHGGAFTDLMEDPAAPAHPSFSTHWRMRDPSLPLTVAIAANRLDLQEVAHVFEMVPERTFQRREYYADYARRVGLYHRFGFSGIRGGPRMAPFAVHRPEDAAPFDERHRGFLLRLKPHVKRALGLQERLRPGAESRDGGLAALEGHREATLVVDADLRLLHINRAAEEVVAAAAGLLRLVGGPACGRGRGVATLEASRPADAAAVRRLVREVALRGLAGGTWRLAEADGAGGTTGPGMTLCILPVPARLLDGGRETGTVAPGRAMVVLTDLRRRAAPPRGLLSELFGLSRSEAAVATALAAGATAESVAAERAVSVQTVRTQIRIVLRKTGASGLRDLERIMALLPRR